jgi:hypothetical protein
MLKGEVVEIASVTGKKRRSSRPLGASPITKRIVAILTPGHYFRRHSKPALAYCGNWYPTAASISMVFFTAGRLIMRS